MYRAIEERGKGHAHNVKRALKRLHAAGREGGGVSVEADNVGIGGNHELSRIVMAMPLAELVSSIPSSTVIYGKVLAVEAKRTGMQLRVKPPDGAAIEMEAEERVAMRAAKFFNRNVEVRAQAQTTEQWPWSQWQAIEINA